jgi:membrane-associated phospholipid phosphatase
VLRLRTQPSSRSVPWSASGPMAVAAAGLLLCVAVVAMLSIAVGANDPIPLDRAVDRMIPHPAVGDGTRLLSPVRDIGGEKGAFAIAAIAGLLVWVRSREWITGISMIAAYTGASATTFILKETVGRRGPSAFDPTSQGLSFPSAHTARVVAVLGVLVLFTALLGSRRSAILLGIAGSLAVAAMMIAQLYVQRHWLTDQIGGIAVGAGWAFIMVPVAVRVVAGRTGALRRVGPPRRT